MKDFSILFLRNPYARAYQYSFSSRLLYGIGSVLLLGLSSLIGLYYYQHQQIIQQQEVIAAQQVKTDMLQQEINSFSEKEQRIAFLENYVEQLKTTASESKMALQKHKDLFKASADKLVSLHNYLCQTVGIECFNDAYQLDRPQDAMAMLEKLQRNFHQLDKSTKQFSVNKTKVSEQEATIQSLRNQIAHTEQELSQHLQIIKSKEDAIDKLSKRIHQVTGINFNLDRQGQLPALKTAGRGGPSSTDDISLKPPTNYTEKAYLNRYLQETSVYYDSMMKSFESLSAKIEQDSNLWQRTPTVRPINVVTISDRFGRRLDPFTGKPDFHAGLDFPAEVGEPIFAPADGVVAIAGRHNAYGLMVEIDHGLGFHTNQREKVLYATRYGHLSKIKVQPGEKIKRGDLLGLVGSTGRSTGSHLHYEVLINGRNIDPALIFAHFSSKKDQLR